MWELFWKRIVFWFKGCSRHFCLKKGYDSKVFHLCQQEKGLWFKGLLISSSLARKGYDSKGSREMGSFQSTCSKASIKVISEYHDFGTGIFGHWKGFGRLEVIASLDAYQITKYQNPTKTYHFFITWFLKNSRKRVSKSGVLWPIDQKVHLIFQKLCPSGHQGLLFKWFPNERESLSRWIYYQQ